MKFSLSAAARFALAVSVIGAVGVNAEQLPLAKAQGLAKAFAQSAIQKVQAGVPANEFASQMALSGVDASKTGNTALAYEWKSSSTTWDTSSITTCTRNSDGKPIEYLMKDFSAGQWQNLQKEIITYNTNKLLDTATVMLINADLTTWDTLAIFAFTYSQDTIKTLSWSMKYGTQWSQITGTFYYSPTTSGQLDSMIMTLGGTMQMKTHMLYADDGAAVGNRGYSRIGTSGAWLSSKHTSISTPTAGTKVEVSQKYDTTTTEWVNVDSTITVSDANDNPTTVTTFIWPESAWLAESKDSYTYSGTSLTEKLSQIWDNTGSAWVNSSKSVYSTDVSAISYRNITVTKSQPVAVSITTAANGDLHFLVSSSAPTTVSLNIYAMNGKLVCSFVKDRLLKGTSSFALDSKNLSGAYVCRIVTPRGISNMLFSVAK